MHLDDAMSPLSFLGLTMAAWLAYKQLSPSGDAPRCDSLLMGMHLDVALSFWGCTNLTPPIFLNTPILAIAQLSHYEDAQFPPPIRH